MNDNTATRRRYLRIAYLLGFIGDFNMAMISIVTILHATALRATTVQVGWIGTAYGISYCFMPILMGKLSDRMARRTSLIISTFLQSFMALLLLFDLRSNALSLFYPFTISILVGLGVAYSFYWPTIEAFISEYSEHSDREHERAFSNFCVWWGLGIALGAWVGGLLSEKSLILVGFIALFLYFAALLLTLYILPKSDNNSLKNLEISQKADDSPSPPQDNVMNGQNLQDSERKTINPSILWVVLIGNFMFAVLARLISTYFANYAKLPEGLNYSGWLIGNVSFLFGFARMAYFYIGRYFSKNIYLLPIGAVLSGFSLLILYLTTSLAWILVALIILGLLNGLIYYIALVLLMHHEKKEKGTKAGLFEAMVGIGSSIAPIIAGSLAIISLPFPFLAFALFSIAMATIQSILARKTKKERK